MKVSGLDGLINGLNKKINVEQVVTDNTNLLRGKAVRRAPVDTGYLRGSITSSVSKSGTKVTGVVRATANYSGYVEEGTRYMQAQPYLKPSLNEVKPKFESDLMRLFNDK